MVPGLLRRASRLGLSESPFLLEVKVEELVLDTNEDVFRTMSFGLMRGSKIGSTKPRLIVHHHSRWGDRLRMPITLFRDSAGHWQEKVYRLELRQSVSPAVRFCLASFTINATQHARDASDGERCGHFQRVDLYAPQLRGLDGTATVRVYIRCVAADALAGPEDLDASGLGDEAVGEEGAAEGGGATPAGKENKKASPSSETATSPATSFFSPLARRFSSSNAKFATPIGSGKSGGGGGSGGSGGGGGADGVSRFASTPGAFVGMENAYDSGRQEMSLNDGSGDLSGITDNLEEGASDGGNNNGIGNREGDDGEGLGEERQQQQLSGGTEASANGGSENAAADRDGSLSPRPGGVGRYHSSLKNRLASRSGSKLREEQPLSRSSSGKLDASSPGKVGESDFSSKTTPPATALCSASGSRRASRISSGRSAAKTPEATSGVSEGKKHQQQRQQEDEEDGEGEGGRDALMHAADAALERLTRHQRRGTTGDSIKQTNVREMAEWEGRVAALEEQLEGFEAAKREAEAKYAEAMESIAEERERAEFLTGRVSAVEQENESLRQQAAAAAADAAAAAAASAADASEENESSSAARAVANRSGNGSGQSNWRDTPAGERMAAELEEAVTLLEVCAERMASLESALERRRGEIRPPAFAELKGLLQLALDEVP